MYRLQNLHVLIILIFLPFAFRKSFVYYLCELSIDQHQQNHPIRMTIPLFDGGQLKWMGRIDEL